MLRILYLFLALVLTSPLLAADVENPQTNASALITGILSVSHGGTGSATGGAGGTLVGIQTFCPSGCTTTVASGATGTYTRNANATRAIVEIIGPGGGSGGSSTASAVQISAVAGAGSGGYCFKNIASVGTGLTVTIGAHGAAGTAGSGSGGSGGTSSFDTAGSNFRATGGALSAGAGVNVIATSTGGVGGIGVGCDINEVGQSGFNGFGIFPTGFFGLVSSGAGGMAPHGGGGGNGSIQTSTGSVGGFPGGGAGGAATNPSGTQQVGAIGGDSIVIVYEYTQ